ncbi:MAG TPA: hypothetical protein VF624_00150 [Tepidisphaeraceae bacterium]|jgi:hypothetical protein
MLDGIGEFREDGDGSWTAGVWLAARKDGIGVSFITGDCPPGEREAAFWRRVSGQWPQLWKSVLDDLRRELYFPSDEAADKFFSAIRPLGFTFHDVSAGNEHWEIQVEPNYSEHFLRIVMRGMHYEMNCLDG